MTINGSMNREAFLEVMQTFRDVATRTAPKEMPSVKAEGVCGRNNLVEPPSGNA